MDLNWGVDLGFKECMSEARLNFVGIIFSALGVMYIEKVDKNSALHNLKHYRILFTSPFSRVF